MSEWIATTSEYERYCEQNVQKVFKKCSKRCVQSLEDKNPDVLFPILNVKSENENQNRDDEIQSGDLHRPFADAAGTRKYSQNESQQPLRLKTLPSSFVRDESLRI